MLSLWHVFIKDTGMPCVVIMTCCVGAAMKEVVLCTAAGDGFGVSMMDLLKLPINERALETLLAGEWQVRGTDYIHNPQSVMDPFLGLTGFARCTWCTDSEARPGMQPLSCSFSS